MRTTRTGPTSIKPLWRPLLLRIDHVLVSDGVCASEADRVRVPGADHRALVVRVGPCPPGGSASAGAANGAGSDGLS
jgi:endonuclease/exonuclease/phosphatase (EEP) superfamily protein YafD